MDKRPENNVPESPAATPEHGCCGGEARETSHQHDKEPHKEENEGCCTGSAPSTTATSPAKRGGCCSGN